jgi:hypothetical protein
VSPCPEASKKAVLPLLSVCSKLARRSNNAPTNLARAKPLSLPALARCRHEFPFGCVPVVVVFKISGGVTKSKAKAAFSALVAYDDASQA